MQDINNFKYLKFTELKNTIFWDYYSLSNKNKISSHYPLAKLSEVLKHRKDFITINDTKLYKRCRVQIQGRGVVLRDEIIGREIKTKKQQICIFDDFLVAEIDAKVGGYGIVPKELDGSIVSGHYFLFEIDKNKLIPEYLGILVKQEQFSKQVKSTGSTNYAAIRPYHVLDYQIPLPTLEEQLILVNNYNFKINQAQAIKEKIDFLEAEIENYFLECLGIKKEEKHVSKKGLQFFEFQEFDRWDIWVNKVTIATKKYKPIGLGKLVIGKPIYGANVKGVKVKSDTRYIRITDINENGTLNDEFVSPEIVEEKYLLKENDFLIARSGNTVGKTFLYKENYGRAIFAGYLVKYTIDYSKVIPEYLLEYTKSYPFKKWILSNQRIAGQPNINGQEYLQAPIIIPPIEIQKEIIDFTYIKKSQINTLQSEMKELENEADLNFNNTLF